MSLTRHTLLVASAVLMMSVAGTARAQESTFAYETVIDGYHLSSGRGVAVDNDACAYVIEPWYEDGQHLDILIVKLDAEGVLLWTTTMTGYDRDYATGITVDVAPTVYVTGWTDSDDFPTTADALFPEQVHFRDAFLMKLAGEGGSILYSTYLGGDYTDERRAIALNRAGDIRLLGTTGSIVSPPLIFCRRS